MRVSVPKGVIVMRMERPGVKIGTYNISSHWIVNSMYLRPAGHKVTAERGVLCTLLMQLIK